MDEAKALLTMVIDFYTKPLIQFQTCIQFCAYILNPSQLANQPNCK